MATWYIARFSGNRIDPVEVDRETDLSVWARAFSGQRALRQFKDGANAAYRPTWEAAHAALMSRRESDVDFARRRLELANATLGNVKGMKKPEGA